MMRKLLIISLLVLLPVMFYAQNTVVTDDDSYTAHNSAMLDVYSLSKGLLVPRLTAVQRTGIASPADGLLVYDTDADTYYYYANSAWHTIDAPSLWSENDDTVYITGVGKRYGVGTASPVAKLTVQGDATIASDEPLFEVKNSAGDVIFAVYENEVKVNFKEGAKGVKGGFAIGGLTGTKSEPVEYMRITPDSVRIYIDDTGAKGVKGGFAIGGLTGTKGRNEYFKLDDESASIYLKQAAKGVKGGFAIGGLTGTKGSEDFLTIGRDSARMYINDPGKGVKGGFAIGGLTGTKAGTNFLDLTPDNYFIGHESGSSMTTGLYNAFLGYQAGRSNTEGGTNLFMGYQAGYSNTTGDENTFIGYQAGFLNEATQSNIYIGPYSGYSDGVSGPFTNYWNVFIGPYAGYSTEGVTSSVYVGYEAGRSTTVAAGNTFVGGQSGRDNTSGSGNAFFGFNSGIKMKSGSGNVFVGSSAAVSDTAGSYNTYLGANAGNKILKSVNNVLVGYSVARFKTGGDDNVMIGYNAGYNSATSSQNVFIGSASGENNTGNGNVFIGYNAGQNETGSNKLYISNNALSNPLIYGEFDNGFVKINGNTSETILRLAPRIGVNGTSEIQLSEDSTNTYGMIIRYEGQSENDLQILGKSGGTTYGPILSIDRAGYLSVNGTPGTTWRLFVNGAAGGTYSWNSTSDLRYKKEISTIQNAIEKVMKLRGVNYSWRKEEFAKMEFSDKRQIGFIAQEIEKVLPEVVNHDENNYLSVEYAKVVPVLVNAMQEQQKEIESLKNQSEEIEKIKMENKELRDMINQIQQKLE